MNSNLITIGQAAKMLGISIQTLRRWDDAKKLSSVRKTKTGNRYYKKEDIESFNVKNIFKLAKIWIKDSSGFEPRQDFYCSNSFVFQSRLSKLESKLKKIDKLNVPLSLLLAIVGEIGNNSFDHNLGNWPDIPGIFFSYNLNRKEIVLVDRGQGILATLKRVRPNLKNHQQALRMAFTKVISGRAPEYRGNGLKFVKKAVFSSKISLFFQTGNACLKIEKRDSNLRIQESNINLRGCLALIKF